MNILNSKGNEQTSNVLVALCVHRGIDPETYSSLTFLQSCPNPKIAVAIKSGDALIDRSRSIVASKFVENKNYDILFFIDDDIVFDPKDVQNICLRMRQLNLPILGGACVKKQDHNPHFAIKTTDNCVYEFGPAGKIYEVEMIGTGFTAYKREVFEAIVKAELVHYCHGGSFGFYPFFNPYEKQLPSKEWIYLSEDWAFVDRAKQLGFKCYVDTTVKLGHAGRYVYNWDDFERFKEEKKPLLGFDYTDLKGSVLISPKSANTSEANKQEALK